MKCLLLFAAMVLTVSASASVNVTVSSPTNGSQVGSTFTVTAAATSGYPIVGWHIYVDSNDVFAAGVTSSITATLTAGSGVHQVVTRAWDSSGAYNSVSEQITVTSSNNKSSSSSGLPTPPANAVWYYSLESQAGWTWCSTAGCAGGNAGGTQWMAQHQTTPSLSGSSLEFYDSGTWHNSLWWKKVGANDWAHNLLWDFWFYVGSNSLSATQALEFDQFQFVGGYNYMIGSQCDYGRGVWDTWNEAAGQWVPTSIACPKFSPNTWHHVQWYTTTNTSAHTYTYVTLVVDGKSTPVNYTGYAKYLNWGDNLGVQYQLDDNATGGGYEEWIDNAQLAIW